MHEPAVALQVRAVQRMRMNLSQGRHWQRKGRRKGGKEKGQIRKEKHCHGKTLRARPRSLL